MKVPKKIHQVWAGDAPLPKDLAAHAESWRTNHPDWEYKLWRDRDLEDLPGYSEFAATAQKPSVKSDIARLLLMRDVGGVYLDIDFAFVRSLDTLGDEPWLCPGQPQPIPECFTAAMGCAPGSALLHAAAAQINTTKRPLEAAGPRMFKRTMGCVDCSEFRILEPHFFYPIPFGSKYKFAFPSWKQNVPDTTVGAHLWLGSWL